MATASTIVISAKPGAEFAVPTLSEEAAARASKLLQENHDKHDIIFSDVGFHSKSVLTALESREGKPFQTRAP